MNVWLHPAITVLWLAKLVITIWLLAVVWMNPVPRFVFPFVAWSVLKTAAMLYCSVRGLGWSYAAVDWAGTYVGHVLAFAMVCGCVMTTFQERKDVWKPGLGWFDYALMSSALLVFFVSAYRSGASELLVVDQALHLWVFGMMVLVAIFLGRNELLCSLLVLYGVGYLASCVRLWLVPYYDWTHAADWVIGISVESLVFLWWLKMFRRRESW